MQLPYKMSLPQDKQTTMQPHVSIMFCLVFTCVILCDIEMFFYTTQVPLLLSHSMVLQQPDLVDVFLQVPVPLLLFLCLVAVVVRLGLGLVVEVHRQGEVAVGKEGHVVLVRYVELHCLFFTRPMMTSIKGISRCNSSRRVPLACTLVTDCCGTQ